MTRRNILKAAAILPLVTILPASAASTVKIGKIVHSKPSLPYTTHYTSAITWYVTHNGVTKEYGIHTFSITPNIEANTDMLLQEYQNIATQQLKIGVHDC